jgi:hypothetical protein
MNLKNCKKGCAETLKIEKNGGKMASWLETFISKYNNKVTAETNVKNLPKVNWKDETFYVNFNPDGAVLYNDYGNEVSLIDDAKTVEDVNKYLNENSIVASVEGNDSTDCEDKDEDKTSTNQEENDKEADRTVVGNEDIEDSSVDTGADVTADIDDSFENELKKVAEAPELPGMDSGINNDNIARGVDGGGNIEGESGMPSVDSLEPGSNESTANVKKAYMPMEDPDKPEEPSEPEEPGEPMPMEPEDPEKPEGPDDTGIDYESASIKDDKKRKNVAFGVEKPGSSIQSFEEQVLTPPNAGGFGFATDSDGSSSDSGSDDSGSDGTTGKVKSKKRLQVAFSYGTPGGGYEPIENQMMDSGNPDKQEAPSLLNYGPMDGGSSDSDSSDSSSDDETTGSLKTAGEVCPICGKNPCVCKSKGEGKDERPQPLPAKYVNDRMVSKASFNKLVARINSLEKTIKSAIGEINVDDGIGEDGMGHGHSEPGPDSDADPGTGIGGEMTVVDDNPDTTGNLKANSKSVKADDYSENSDSTGFQDIANGVGDAVSSVGDAISNAWDSACSWSQGDHIYGSKRLIAFSEQQYAHTETPNDAYDLHSEDEEVKHFEEAAQDTQKIIDKEHELDLSNMNDRVKLNENFLNELFSIGNDVPVENDDVEEVIEEPTEDIAEEPMVEETVDAPVDIEEDVEAPDDVEVVEETPETEEDTIEIQDDSNPDDVVIMLENPEDLEEFMNQVCPCCEEENHCKE